MTRTPALEPVAIVAGEHHRDLIEATSDLSVLDSTGKWVVHLPFVGEPVCARFADVGPFDRASTGTWPGLEEFVTWQSSLDADAFASGVGQIRERIAAGEVYQVNLTRRLRTPLPAGADIVALAGVLAEGNPAPYEATLRLGEINVACASPELFLARRSNQVWSSPIKGTAGTPAGFLDKDRAENVMITDLVRNDLGRVCEWGSVRTEALCSVESHPGLAHYVSTVSGRLRADAGWAELIDATFPPGSVTGAPKIAALDVIDELEPDERGPYCGAIGWVDADRDVGELAVMIRTFWFDEGDLCFGTGGGITWGSDPRGEWEETELKAANLLAVAGHRGAGSIQ